MKHKFKKYFWEIIIFFSGLAYSFEWFFIRDLSEKWFSWAEIHLWKSFFLFSILIAYFLYKSQIRENIAKIRKIDLLYIWFPVSLSLLGNIIFNNAMSETSVANVMTIVYLCTIWAFFIWIFALKEKVTKLKFFYVLMAFLWIILTVNKDIFAINIEFWKWEFYALVCSFIMSISPFFNKKLEHINSYFRVFIFFFIHFISILIFLFITKELSYFMKFIDKDFLILSMLFAFTTGLLWKWLRDYWTRFVPSYLVLILTLSDPISQIITSIIFAWESINIVNIIWIIMVLSAWVLISKK